MKKRRHATNKDTRENVRGFMIFDDSSKLKFAVPNKGRLREPVIDLLHRSGYKFRVSDKALYATSTNSDLIFVFVRADDIPVLISSGVVDAGITGQDLVVERGARVEELLKLGFGRCRLSVAVGERDDITSIDQLKNKTIVTSFPVLTQSFFAAKNIPVQCVEMNGSVEIMVPLGLADAIVDLVETGDTLKRNHLRVIDNLGVYEAVLLCQVAQKNDARIQLIKRRLEGVLVAARYCVLEYNISRSKLPEAEKITPGFNSPTLSDLEDKSSVAVKVMVEKDQVVDVMDRLEKLGATAIMETSIQNCRL